MKVIITSNCNTKGYYNYLTAMFPEWDVRAATHVQATEWVTENNTAFLDFLRDVDLFVGLPKMYKTLSAATLNPDAVKIALPSFMYMSPRPDCCWFNGVTSPTEAGFIHSKIAAAAFVAGKSITDTVALFTGSHYENIGFFSQFHEAQTKMLNDHENAGIDVLDAFESWQQNGDFMYTPNHPDSYVLFDIMHLAMLRQGFTSGHSATEVQNIRSGMPNYLAKGCVFPVYPEIAEAFKISNPKTRWRTPVTKAGSIDFELTEMVQRSFALFERIENFGERANTVLGGKDNILSLAAA